MLLLVIPKQDCPLFTPLNENGVYYYYYHYYYCYYYYIIIIIIIIIIITTTTIIIIVKLRSNTNWFFSPKTEY